MPSPFPGMNPYLEQPSVWQDFHQRYLVTLSEQLAAQLGAAYIVKLEQEVYVHELTEDGPRRLLGRPDVGIAAPRGTVNEGAGVALIAAPVVAEVEPEIDVIKLRRIEVRDRVGRDLVAMIELLSPTNKEAGEDREAYTVKRRRMLHSPAHFIELDLLRRGQRMPLKGMPDCDYCVTVSRVEDRPRVGVWPVRLRDPLPTVPVPVRAPHPDATLDLMAALHHVHDAAGYVHYIYDSPPEPPLHPADQQWADTLTRAQRP